MGKEMSKHETNLTFTVNTADIKELKEYMRGPDAFRALSEVRDFLRQQDKYGFNPPQAQMTLEALVSWMRGQVVEIINSNLEDYNF